MEYWIAVARPGFAIDYRGPTAIECRSLKKNPRKDKKKQMGKVDNALSLRDIYSLHRIITHWVNDIDYH